MVQGANSGKLLGGKSEPFEYPALFFQYLCFCVILFLLLLSDTNVSINKSAGQVEITCFIKTGNFTW
jgi:hypothetical protein